MMANNIGYYEDRKIKKQSNLGQPRQTKLCKCGHLKDEHEIYNDKIICSKKKCMCIIGFE